MSNIVIRIDGVDRTNSCIARECSFEQAMGGEPGTFTLSIRDPNRVLSFITGREVTLEVDGVRLFGGYITLISMGHYFEADYIPDVTQYPKRKWILQGPDYNIIFDKRVLRRTSNYKTKIGLSEQMDGALLRRIVNDYCDMNDYSTSGIVDIADVNPGTGLNYFFQGTKLRVYFERFQMFGGAMWYAGPSKNLIYVPFETVEKRWGFSDQPNNLPITASPDEFQGVTIGFRAVDAIEDATTIVNDALIWGGSEWADSGGIVFARRQDEDSQELHNRWQLAETHFGDALFKIQSQVNERARVIVEGPPGTDIRGMAKGLRYPQWTFSFSWFSDDVPRLSGVPDHMRPGDIVPIQMNVFNLTKLLPLRMLRISFPGVFESPDPDDHLVQFDGTFGLNPTDPFTLWKFLLGRGTPEVTQSSVVTVNNTTDAASLGSYYQGYPYPETDGVVTAFKMGTPTNEYGYIPGSIEVYLNGLLQRRITDYTESNFETGEFTMLSAPLTEDTLWVTARTQPK